jgi:hypothetical protein
MRAEATDPSAPAPPPNGGLPPAPVDANIRLVLVPRRDDLPIFPAPEWLEVYNHLKEARNHLKAAEELLRLKRRPTPPITATWQWLEELMLALRATP